MQGTMRDARRRGRPHTAWMDNIKTWTGIIIKVAEDRDKWEKVNSWCGKSSDRGQLNNRTDAHFIADRWQHTLIIVNTKLSIHRWQHSRIRTVQHTQRYVHYLQVCQHTYTHQDITTRTDPHCTACCMANLQDYKLK